MRKAPGGSLECLVDADTRVTGIGLGPGNTNVRVLGGEVGTRYSTHPVPHLPHHPGYHPSAHCHGTPHVDGMRYTAVFGSTKEILGVEYAQYVWCSLDQPHARLTQAPQPPLEPACGACCGLLVGLRSVLSPQISIILHIPQYFSVFLSISEILRYSSVFLSISQYLASGL